MFETKQNRNCFLYNLTRLAEDRVLKVTITDSCIHIHSRYDAQVLYNLTDVHWTCGAPCTLQQSLQT